MNLDYGASRIRDTGRTRTVTYTPVKYQSQRSGKCPVCGKQVSRSRMFEQTISPFNKDPETGEPRTVRQVQVAVREQAAAWEPDFTHAACAGTS